MSIEVRAARAEEMEEFSRLMAYVFAGTPPDHPDAQPQTLQPDWTTCVFVDGRIAVGTAFYPFTMRLNGAGIGVAAITAVGSYPEFRRQGLLRRAMEQGLAEQRERGQSVAILWASMGAIYQRYGYGLGSTQAWYQFDPRYAELQEPLPLTGSVGLESGDETFELIKGIYKQYSASRNLMLHRSVIYWQAAIVNEVEKQRPHIAVYRNGAGEPRGYMIYRVQNRETNEPGPSMVLNVRDFVPLDIEAWRSLWEYIRRHDLVSRVNLNVPPDDPAPNLLLEPRMLGRRTGDGIWLRVVDVERALPQRPYGDTGSLTFEVLDDLCDWNRGCFLLETDGEHSEVKRSERSAELSIPVRSLASLVSGQASATSLARAGLLSARDEGALALADRIFATSYAPYCPDGF